MDETLSIERTMKFVNGSRTWKVTRTDPYTIELHTEAREGDSVRHGGVRVHLDDVGDVVDALEELSNSLITALELSESFEEPAEGEPETVSWAKKFKDEILDRRGCIGGVEYTYQDAFNTLCEVFESESEAAGNVIVLEEALRKFFSDIEGGDSTKVALAISDLRKFWEQKK